MKNRIIIDQIKKKSISKFGRIITITGARQTGKTTLAKECFSEYAYISLEDPITRPNYSNLSSKQWYNQYPQAVLDEIQKVPRLIESIKAVYDEYPDAKYILLGSSQILLLKEIRESLAGRVSIVELLPLTLTEMLTSSWEDSITESKLIKWLKNPENTDIFYGIPQVSEEYAITTRLLSEYLKYGGMPAICSNDISEEEKYDWLYNYLQTYLQRDLRDLAQINDLEPFVLAQRTLSSLTGQIVNYDKVAKLSGVSPKTIKRYISYLNLSYQVIIINSWFRNLNKRLSKSPKIHFLDPGIQREILGRRGMLTGSEFESAIVAEIVKQIKSYNLKIQFYHLRTLDGREIDLVIETDSGFILIEIKMASKVSKTDARSLKITDVFDKPVIHSFILSNDPEVKQFDDNITAMPVAWFLGP